MVGVSKDTSWISAPFTITINKKRKTRKKFSTGSVVMAARSYLGNFYGIFLLFRIDVTTEIHLR